MNKYVFDIETTGTDYFRNEILKISCGIYDDGIEIDSLELSIKPQRKQYWQSEAERVHRISWEQAQGFHSANYCYSELIKFMHFYGMGDFVCHALWFGNYFDRAFIEAQMSLLDLTYRYRKNLRTRTISTITLAKQLQKNGFIEVDSFGLEELCKKFGIKLDHHDAKSDREACAQIYWLLVEEIRKHGIEIEY